MKIALPVLPGLSLGTPGGAAPGIGAGFARAEWFKSTGFEGDRGMPAFFTFMPPGAAIGGIGGALPFGGVRDSRRRNRHRTGAGAAARPLNGVESAAIVQCNNMH